MLRSMMRDQSRRRNAPSAAILTCCAALAAARRIGVLAMAVLGLIGAAAGADEARWVTPEGDRRQQALEAGMAPGMAPMWEIAARPGDGVLEAQPDDLLGRDVLAAGAAVTLESRFHVTPGTVVTGRVRLATTEQARSALLRLHLVGDPANASAASAQLVLQGAFDGPIRGFNYKPYPTISPVLDPATRALLERDMTGVPMSQDRWIPVRLEIGEGLVRGWVDDRLILEQRDLPLTDAARLAIVMSPRARLADLTVQRPAPLDPLFEPIPIDGYVRHRATGSADKPGPAVADDALPFGQTVLIDGVPMRFATRERDEAPVHPDRRLGVDMRFAGLDREQAPDHMDIAASLFRQANWHGYHPSNRHRFVSATTYDPARFQFRVPNDRYRAMHVIAAFDAREHHLPVLSASFYRPGAGFPMVFESRIPGLHDEAAGEGIDAAPLPITLEDGSSAQLWRVRIPLDPAMLASFSDMDALEFELTKQVHQYRSYPDPYIYGWHQGGLPSGVRVYAVTLERSRVDMTLEPTRFGHVWQQDETPAYDVALRNQTPQRRTVRLEVQTVSHGGIEKTGPQRRSVVLAPGETQTVRVDVPVTRNGIHDITVTLHEGDQTWTETRHFCRLAEDTRAVRWEEGQGPLFGYWSYHGGHYTAPGEEHLRLMSMAGARATIGRPKGEAADAIWEKHGFLQGPNAWAVQVGPNRAWAEQDEPDPEVVKAFQERTIQAFRQAQGDNPRIVTFFPEPHISRDLTAGNPPDYWGEPAYEMSEQERRSLRLFWNISVHAARAVRKTWPDARILIPWGDPLFVVPFLREGFPRDLIDGSALDIIGFERLPEQQIHQQSVHRIYILKKEFERFGLPDPVLPYVEGPFVPTEPGANTWDEQADRYHRGTLISLAYGITEFYSGWFAFDCGSYYGAEHYGGCGIQRRIPYNDPKPGYAHYATMTRMLERATFKRWVPTGSLTTFCLEFDHPDRGPTYAMWTVRGERPATLTLAPNAQAHVTDAMDNTQTLASRNEHLTITVGQVTVTLGTSPIYVHGAGRIKAVTLGQPDHSDAIPWSRQRNQDTWGSGPLGRLDQPEINHVVPLGNFGDGSWRNTDERDEVYETNNYDTQRFHGRMTASVVEPDDREGAALAVRLLEQDVERQLMPWYTVIRPEQPVEIPGSAAALGAWVRADSDWGRIIYSLRDAKGERWISIGHQDEWNCDDVHSWASFNFDGWRYLRFELPGHLPWDHFQTYGTTWWRFAGGDGVVDLPLTLEKIIVERRTHVIHANDIQPTDAESNDVLLGEFVAEYASEADADEQAVQLSRLTMPTPAPPAELPNPIAEMQAANTLPATTLHGVRDPDWGYDGTRCHVLFDAVEDAAGYQVWVSAHADGRGAVLMGRFREPGQLLQGLRAATTFHLWVTWTNADGAQSKPSNRLEINLIDAFGMK